MSLFFLPQKWKNKNFYIKHLKSNLCLDSSRKDKFDVIATSCNDSKTQRWTFERIKKPNYLVSQS